MHASSRTPATQKSPSARRLTSLIVSNTARLHDARKRGDFVIWAAICAPVEIFKGFEHVIVAIPENFSAMSAGKGVALPLAQRAESLGYSMDLCSYARIGIGAEIGTRDALDPGGLPKPDLLVSDTNNCSLLVKWFEVYRQEFSVPHFILDVPFCYDVQQPKDLEYILHQFKALITVVEQMTGQTFDIEKCRAAVECTDHANKYWKEYLGFATNRPSGITAFDTFAQMAPFVMLRGEPEVLEHYKLLAEETRENVSAGVFPVPREKYRLLWDNIAPWHQLRAMRERLAALGANIVHATYTSCIGTVEGGFFHHPYDVRTDPLVHLARIQNFSVCPYGLSLRFEAMAAIIKNVGIDGVILASNRSCKVYSIMQMDLQRMITENLGIPCAMIDMDHADIRKYDEESAFLRIESLLDVIDQRR